LENVDGILKEGDIIQVKLIEVDKKTGKLKLSRKALLPKPAGMPERSKPAEDQSNGGKPQRKVPTENQD
jgi:polyribonucleotide nucleotidyltransferase